ncbi:unnamed protein product [Didymodactylos carnosus]|uniref:NET domain-containing protein n=1 Tax=Didymodactylos carnosus TaxID=1234261 RepID=A0A815JA56_9BILA|nr:unnamed protein product [Didymodactylos carnosus]CAF4273247.1 unnamed protein product [Didymodactylos carnosus]
MDKKTFDLLFHPHFNANKNNEFIDWARSAYMKSYSNTYEGVHWTLRKGIADWLEGVVLTPSKPACDYPSTGSYKYQTHDIVLDDYIILLKNDEEIHHLIDADFDYVKKHDEFLLTRKFFELLKTQKIGIADERVNYWKCLLDDKVWPYNSAFNGQFPPSSRKPPKNQLPAVIMPVAMPAIALTNGRIFKEKNEMDISNDLNQTNDDESNDQDKPMSNNEKFQLSRAITSIPNEMLNDVVKLLRKIEPSLIDSNSNEIDIDFERLKPSTLRVLESHVNLILKKNEKKQLSSEVQLSTIETIDKSKNILTNSQKIVNKTDINASTTLTPPRSSAFELAQKSNSVLRDDLNKRYYLQRFR